MRIEFLLNFFWEVLIKELFFRLFDSVLSEEFIKYFVSRIKLLGLFVLDWPDMANSDRRKARIEEGVMQERIKGEERTEKPSSHI